MKTKLLTSILGFCLAITLNAQSIAITSVDVNPIEIDPVSGGTLTVYYTYTTENTDDLVYVALEKQDDWTWIETTADGSNNPVTMGTDLTGSITLTIPNTATLSADLTGTENYKIIVKLNDSAWEWRADANQSVTLEASTAGLEDINAYKIVIYPNPVSDRLMLDVNHLDFNSITISNILGQNIKTINDVKNLKSIDVSNFLKGMYVLTTDTKKQFKFLKI